MNRAKRASVHQLDMLDFENGPGLVLTKSSETVPTIAKINIAGGRVLRITRVPGQQVRWKLLVNWPHPSQYQATLPLKVIHPA